MSRLFLLLVLVVSVVTPVLAQPEPQSVTQLETRVSTLEQTIRTIGSGGAAVFLFGAFCALWAQNTGRNAWLWFFLGLLFNVITVLVLLSKNSQGQRRDPPLRKRPFDLQEFREQ